MKIIPAFALIISLLVLNLSAYTGEVIESYDTPSEFLTGLTFDGQYLHLADRKTDKIYKIDPADGSVVGEITAPAYWTTGLTWDGESLWAADIKGGLPLSENYDGKIYKVDPAEGTILHTVHAPGDMPRGLTWDGEYLWCSDNRLDEIIQFSPDDGTTIKSFKSPASDPRGITYDGTYLWIGDRLKDEIYMVDPGTGETLLITEAPGKFVKGLCYDGKNLWAVDDQENKLHKLKIRDGVKFRRTNERKARVRYIHQATNFGPGKIKSMDVHLAIPVNRDNQQLLGEIQYSPEYDDIVTDKWGQKTAHYRIENLKNGEKFEIEMITEAAIYDVRYYIYPDEVGTLDEIPEDIKSKYLENNEKYQIEHPTIQDAADEAVGNEENPYRIMRNIFNFLIDNMYYEMVGGWNTAPAVLERGNGSCSEYSFAYISMCRAAGLPARYAGSVVVRGDDASLDDVFHRWVEVYLPNYGWIPIDPSGGDNEWHRDQANYIGHLANRFLITTQSGGGSETMEWTYNSNESWITEPKTFVVIDNFADWEPLIK